MKAFYEGEGWDGVSQARPAQSEGTSGTLRRAAVLGICEALWRTIESKVPEANRGPELAIGSDGRLGAGLLREAVVQTLLRMVKLSKSEIAKRLYSRVKNRGCLPLRSSKG